MKNISAVAFLTGLSWLGFSSSLQAATLTQDFEIVVDRVFPGFPESDVPPIGTRGQGRFTIDTEQIQFGQTAPFYDPSRVGYFTRQPTSFSLDFFNRRYTNLPLGAGISRFGPIFEFGRTGTGGYQMNSFSFGTTDPVRPGIAVANSYFAYETIASGVVSFTPAEAIPEPETIAGVPIAIALSWACHRRFKRRLKKSANLTKH